MRKHRNVLYALVAGAVLAGAGAVRAQEPPPPAAPPETMFFAHADQMPGEMPGAPLGENVELLGFDEAPGQKTVKGAPFSATAVSETTHVLADGNRIHRTTQSALYRDSEGRFRREVTLPAIGPLAASGKIRSFIVLRDPAAGTAFVLQPEEKIARKLPAPPDGRHAAMQERFEERRKKMEASGELKTVSLGTKTINGVSAEGTRHTRVIPAGQVGNDKPIEIVVERWYSKELQAVVMTKRSDPRFGETTYQLTSIQRKEPDAKLFQVPADYTVKDAPARPMGRFGRRGRKPGMGRGPGPAMGQDQPPTPQP